MPAWAIARSTCGDELEGPIVQTMRVRRFTRGPHWSPGQQIGASDRKVAGQGDETKEGVALGGAHSPVRDDDTPGPLTPVSSS